MIARATYLAIEAFARAYGLDDEWIEAELEFHLVSQLLGE
jgi:hypothetical protein